MYNINSKNMETKKYTILIMFILLTKITFGQAFNLDIVNGYGAGTYLEGDTIHVWSKAVFNDTVFVNWTGSGANYLANNNEWHTTLIVPSNTSVGNLTINANYDTIFPIPQVGSTSFLLYGLNQGVETNVLKETYYAIPHNPKGIVFFIHGTNGNGQHFFSGYNRTNVIKDFVYADFAVFTLDANEVTMGDQDGDGTHRWDCTDAYFAGTSNNIDLKNMQALKDSIINTFNFPATIPCFSLGVSNGANFSDICASALGFKASAHITATGRTGTYLRNDLAPVIWIMSDNDHNQHADNDAAHSNYQTMINSLVHAEYHTLFRSPVYSERFLRNSNNMNISQANSVFQRLLDLGLLDSDYYLTVMDVTNDIPISTFDNLGLTNPQKSEVKQQLLIVNADHLVHSDFNKNIIRFFNQELILSVNEPVQNKMAVRLFPNPVNDELNIEIEDTYQFLEVSVYSIIGKKVLSYKNETRISLGNLLSGVYFVKIKKDGMLKTFKIIKIASR